VLKLHTHTHTHTHTLTHTHTHCFMFTIISEGEMMSLKDVGRFHKVRLLDRFVVLTFGANITSEDIY
jgi:hypothetical protein